MGRARARWSSWLRRWCHDQGVLWWCHSHRRALPDGAFFAAFGRGVRPWSSDPPLRMPSGHDHRRLTRGQRPLSAGTLLPALCNVHTERSPALLPRGRRRRGGKPMLKFGNWREILGIICRGEERSRRQVWAGKTASNVRCGEPVRTRQSSPGFVPRRRSSGSPAEPSVVLGRSLRKKDRELTFQS